jgi:hypothetical protein
MEDIKTTKHGELGIKTIVKYIIGVIAVALIILTGVESIKLGFIFVGILFFALALLVFVPHHRLRVTLPLKAVIIVVLYVVFAAMTGGKGSGTSATKEQKYENAPLGQKVTLVFNANSYSMVVRNVTQETKIKVNDKGVEKEATSTGYFLLVKGEITNLGTAPLDFPLGTTSKDGPELKDSQNRRYTLYGTSISSGQLQPSLSKEFTYFYEIPKEAAGLTFLVKDKTDTIKSIDLKR